MSFSDMKMDRLRKRIYTADLAPYDGSPSTPLKISRRDKTVIKVAKYAVDKHNQQEGTCLEFRRVVKANYLPRRGAWYTIILLASDGEYYEAWVMHKRLGNKDLMCFKSLLLEDGWIF